MEAFSPCCSLRQFTKESATARTCFARQPVKLDSQMDISANSTRLSPSAGSPCLLRYLCNRSDFSKFDDLFGRSRRKQMHRPGNNSRPAGLVTCPKTGSIVAVEIFVKQNVITPVWIFLKLASFSIDRSVAILVFQKDTSET